MYCTRYTHSAYCFIPLASHRLYVGKIFCTCRNAADTAPLLRCRPPAAHTHHVDGEEATTITLFSITIDDYVSTAKIESHVLTSCAMVAIESKGHV